jgi:CubicO group peptidase (beta-lactamase class C family)
LVIRKEGSNGTLFRFMTNSHYVTSSHKRQSSSLVSRMCLTYILSYGNISQENGTNVNGDSIFDIGSITKPFTTTLLVDMVRQGLINLDDPIGKYFPDNVKVPTYKGQMITIGNLATHTSGLPDFPIG